MKVKFIFMGLLLMMSFTACEKITTEAPETLEKIRVSESPAENENAVFSVIIDEWPPYTTSETLEKGICTEIVVKALEAAGMPYKIEFKPWSRALEMVAFGDAWGTVPWFYTEERSKSYAFSDTIFTSNSVVFYHKDNPLFPKEFPEFSTLQDLKAYTFGGVHGYYYEPIFENESFSYTLSQSLESAFKLLIEGKTDVVNEDLNVGMYILKKHYQASMENILFTQHALVKSDMYLLVSKALKNHEETLARFNEGLKIIKENGTYEDIISKSKNFSGKE